MRTLKLILLAVLLINAMLVTYLWNLSSPYVPIQHLFSGTHAASKQQDTIDPHPVNSTNNHTLRGHGHENNCTEAFRKSHYLLLEFRRGRTGNALFQVYGLLAYSSRFCYTPIIDSQNRIYMRSVDPFFDLRHVKMLTVRKGSFGRLTDVKSNASQTKLTLGHHNWTMQDRCLGYDYIEGQEQFVRSSIRFKKHIEQEVVEYLQKYFTNRSTVAIHVRRTDRVGYDNAHDYIYNNLTWYPSYIEHSMDYLKSKHARLSFIFISDDVAWCRKHFHGDDVHFSPFKSAGRDLVLMTRSDHVILTVGTFGWHGAWLGEHKSVVYSRKYAMPRFANRFFFFPSWIVID